MYLTRRDGSVGRSETSITLTGSAPLLKSVTVCRSLSSLLVATPKSIWSGDLNTPPCAASNCTGTCSSCLSMTSFLSYVSPFVRLSTSLMDPSWRPACAARSFTERTTLLLFDGSSQMVLGKLLTPPRPELFAFSMIALSSSSNLFCDSRSSTLGGPSEMV